MGPFDAWGTPRQVARPDQIPGSGPNDQPSPDIGGSDPDHYDTSIKELWNTGGSTEVETTVDLPNHIERFENAAKRSRIEFPAFEIEELESTEDRTMEYSEVPPVIEVPGEAELEQLCDTITEARDRINDLVPGVLDTRDGLGNVREAEDPGGDGSADLGLILGRGLVKIAKSPNVIASLAELGVKKGAEVLGAEPPISNGFGKFTYYLVDGLAPELTTSATERRAAFFSAVDRAVEYVELLQCEEIKRGRPCGQLKDMATEQGIDEIERGLGKIEAAVKRVRDEDLDPDADAGAIMAHFGGPALDELNDHRLPTNPPGERRPLRNAATPRTRADWNDRHDHGPPGPREPGSGGVPDRHDLGRSRTFEQPGQVTEVFSSRVSSVVEQ